MGDGHYITILMGSSLTVKPQTSISKVEGFLFLPQCHFKGL